MFFVPAGPRKSLPEERTHLMGLRVAKQDLYGHDGSGVRRRVPAGAPIPPGITFEEPIDDLTVDMPPELARAGVATTLRADVSEPVVYGDLTTEELQAKADELGLAVEGTGKGGNVVKADLVAALEAHDAQNA
jgi:hypothetical protein